GNRALVIPATLRADWRADISWIRSGWRVLLRVGCDVSAMAELRSVAGPCYPWQPSAGDRICHPFTTVASYPVFNFRRLSSFRQGSRVMLERLERPPPGAWPPGRASRLR